MHRTIFFSIVFAAAALCQPSGQPPAAAPKPAPSAKPAPKTEKPPETAPPSDLMPGEDTEGVSLELGAQVVDVDGEKTFGFQKYRDIPQGAVMRRFDFMQKVEGTRRRFNVHVLDFMQRDMRIRADLENPGKYKVEASYDGSSRFWGNNGRSVLTEVQRGVFTEPAALRTSLENAAIADLPGLARNALAASPAVEVRSNRQRGTVEQTYHFTPRLTLNLSLMQERRTGNRPIAFGTFSRTGTAIGDTFETPGQELWEPTAFGTTEFGVGLTYARAHFFASLDYRGSLFYNHTQSLNYQNPFRITAASATPVSTNPQPATGGASGGGGNRGRFADLQSSLPPNNQAQSITASAAYFGPRSSKVAGLVSWGRWTQNQAFLPYTNNPAVVVNPGQAGPTQPLTSLAALPQQSLDAIIRTFTGDFVATTRPIKPVQITLHYNNYDLDNGTQQIHFPGSVAVLNSFWSNFHTGTPGRANVPLDTRVRSYDRQRFSLEGSVKPIKDFIWNGKYQYELWNRSGRQVDVSRENGVTSSVSYAPTPATYLEAGAGYFHRRPDLYSDRGGLENLLIRMFDQSNRLHKQANAMASVSPSQVMILSGSWNYSSDVYDKSLLGLHQMKSYSASVDASFNFSSAGFYAGWGYDRNGYNYVGGTGASLPPSLRFGRDTRDGVHTAHTGWNGTLAHGKFTYQLKYAVSLSRLAIATSNIDPVPVSNQLNSEASPFPVVKNQFHEIRLDASYQISKRLAIGLHYLLEPYRLNDFANDLTQPYGGDAVTPVQGTTPVQNDARRFYFLDVGPTNYLGRMASAYLRFQF